MLEPSWYIVIFELSFLYLFVGKHAEEEYRWLHRSIFLETNL